MSNGLTPRTLPSGASCPRKSPTWAKVPEVGMFVTMFLSAPRGWQDTLGSGWRNFMVLKVGRKWITLFNPASLKSFEISFGEWATLKPREYDPGAVGLTYLASALPPKVKQYEAYSMQHRAACTAQALSIVQTKLEATK